MTPGEDRAAWRTLALTCAVAFSSTLDISIVVVAFGDIRADFGDVADAQLSWVITAYTVVAAAMLVPCGRLADRIGAHRTFFLGIAAFTTGSLLSGLAPSVELLIAARVVQALGSAFQMPSALTLIATSFPAGRRSMAVGLWGAVSGLGGAVGPSLGAFVVHLGGWRWVFLMNVPLGLVVLVAALRWVGRVAPRPALPSDLVGALLLMTGVTALTLALVQTRSWGWIDGRVAAVALLGVALLGALVVHSTRHPAPIVDLSLFRIPSFRWANAVAFAFPIAFFVQFFGSVQFLTSVWGYSSLEAGLLLTPVTVVQAALTLQAGRLADARGHRAVMVPGALLHIAGSVVWLVALGSERELGWWYLGATLAGVGVGLTYGSFNSAAVHGLPPERLGSGSGVNLTINRVAGTLGIALAVALSAGPATPRVYDRLWTLMLVGGVVTVLCSSRIDTRPRAVVSTGTAATGTADAAPAS